MMLSFERCKTNHQRSSFILLQPKGLLPNSGESWRFVGKEGVSCFPSTGTSSLSFSLLLCFSSQVRPETPETNLTHTLNLTQFNMAMKQVTKDK